jgi:hypothetical protein
MEKLEVPHLNFITKRSSLQEVSSALDTLERNSIQVAPWPDFSYKPNASFAIAYNDNCIFLKYYIQENTFRASCFNTNDPVSQDSCVEFFISFGNEVEYYNLEFNCIGTCLAGFGVGKTERELIPEESVRIIRRCSVIISSTDSGLDHIFWELTLIIPSEIFIHHSDLILKDMHCKANFYKCGDKLPRPHFLAWKKVESTTPNFHLPEYFGSMHFV